jgi:ZIP family zinc transporter
LAVGVAFGALVNNADAGMISGAIALAIGIGLQNFPEGAAVSIPLRREGFSRLKAFNYGQISGLVEPIAGVAGAILVSSLTNMLPFALSFAAGAMIYVVVEELIPESQRGDETDLSTIGTIIGFATMMLLDVALG